MSYGKKSYANKGKEASKKIQITTLYFSQKQWGEAAEVQSGAQLVDLSVSVKSASLDGSSLPARAWGRSAWKNKESLKKERKIKTYLGNH